MKERLDILLVKKGLAPSREKAKTMIMEGNVFVDNNREDKAGSSFDENAKIEIKGNTLKYVSRGGLKLEKAMTHFGITLDGKVCMDIGASTVCCKMVQVKYMRLTSDTDSSRGSCARMSVLSAWRRQISAM